MNSSKQLFLSSHVIIGRISDGERTAENLEIQLNYSQTERGEVVGRISCDSDSYFNLAALQNSPSELLTFESNRMVGGRYFHSKNFYISSVGDEHVTEVKSEFYGELKFGELSIEYDNQLQPQDRQIVFYVDGPREAWAVRETTKPDITGNIRNELKNTELRFSDDLPFTVEVRPWYFYERMDGILHHKKAFAVCLKVKDNHVSIADEDFLALALTFIDDLGLLVSLMSRAWVHWYRYDYIHPTKLIQFIKGGSRQYLKSQRKSELLIEQNHSKRFMAVALEKYRLLRSEHFDLRSALIYNVSGHEAKYVESKFTNFFLCLERIKDIYSTNRQIGHNLPDDKFEILSKTIRDLIRDQRNILGTNDPSVRRSLYSKINELNRPSLRDILDRIFAEFHIEWSDLYPADHKLSLIDTRNTLFHTTTDIDATILYYEMTRLKFLLDRIITRMLGWTEKIEADHPWELTWLTK